MAGRDLSAPLACSLGAGALRERGRAIADLFAEAIAGERTAEGVRIRFGASERVHERLEALVVAERECCPFLTFELARSGASVVLAVTAPPDAQPAIEPFAEAVPPSARR